MINKGVVMLGFIVSIAVYSSIAIFSGVIGFCIKNSRRLDSLCWIDDLSGLDHKDDLSTSRPKPKSNSSSISIE